MNGDGVLDVVTVPGRGGGPHVKVFDGVTGTAIRSFFAFDPRFLGGLFVASADINNDGFADIIVGADSGGGPHVCVFSGADTTELLSFFAYDPGFLGGVRVAVGDITNDGIPDIITGPGPGGGPHIRVFDPTTPQSGVGTDIGGPAGSFYAYDPGFSGGVFVAAANVGGSDSRVDIITGPGAGGGPNVRVFDGATGMLLSGPVGNFFAYDAGFLGGVRVSANDLTGDGKADIITVPGTTGGPDLRVFDATNLNIVRNIFIGDPGFRGGLFVAGSPRLLSSGAALHLAEGFAPSETAASLTLAEAQPVFEAALVRLADAGVSKQEIRALSTLTIQVADLNGSLIGEALPGRILLDINGAGVGWFIDPTPRTDEEFSTPGLNAIDPAALGRVDLLTVILHELGHQLGGVDLDSHDSPGHLMADTLAPSERRLPRQEELDELFSQKAFLNRLLD